jgi:hypothetical protein
MSTLHWRIFVSFHHRMSLGEHGNGIGGSMARNPCPEIEGVE